MKIFLDTSSLFKLYHVEIGSEDIVEIVKNNSIQEIYLSEITKIEFNSTVCRKVRNKEIDDDKAKVLISTFSEDYGKYIFIETNTEIINMARDLVEKYLKEGLRTLDSIHLASGVKLKDEIDVFKSSDILLNKTFELEGLAIT